jgi:hypothetical protein
MDQEIENLLRIILLPVVKTKKPLVWRASNPTPDL